MAPAAVVVEVHSKLMGSGTPMDNRLSVWLQQSGAGRDDYDPDKDAIAATLEHAIADVRRAVDEMRAGPSTIHHYGG